ncbi:MAG TPA: formate/nitrite transporter family protein [Patescibacteria group bacterium]|nr:formate/nitrite transporter family protein [Patescibacteria group bacterium]
MVNRKPPEIAKAVCDAGEKKARLPFSKMFLLAVLAGVYIGFGAQLATTASMDMIPMYGVGVTQVVAGTVFSVGLMLVVLAGAELFTGNNLVLLSCLSNRTGFLEVVRSWAIVYGGNLVGALLLVTLVYAGGLYDLGGGALGLRALAIANGKVNLGFIPLMARGVLCNWLVCLAVWLTTSTDDAIGKIFACLFPIMAFVSSGYEHSVANMFFIPIGILLMGVPSIASQFTGDLSNLTWAGFIGNLIPVTIGNIIGGAFFVATLYWYIYKED